MKKSLLLASIILLASCAKSETTLTPPAAPLPPTAPTVATRDFDAAYSEVKSEYRDSAVMNNCMVNSINMCLSQAVGEKARTKNDEAICDDLSDAMAADFCKQGIILAKIEKDGDLSLCDTLKQNKDACIGQAAISLAMKKKDLKICDSIKTPAETASGSVGPMMPSQKDNCINQAAFNIAMSTQDEKYCDKIISPEQKKMCLTSLETQKTMMKNNAPTPLAPPAPETPKKKSR